MSSPSTSSGPPVPKSQKIRRASTRSKLRNSTFVIPSTSQRAHRQITLRNPPPGFDGARSTSLDGLRPFERRWSSAGTWHTAVHNTKVALRLLWDCLKSPTGTNVLKCSVAYLLACMCTLSPPLAGFLGKQDGKHVVATMVTYFHPGRSVGAMVEAVLLLVVAMAYAVFISVASMATSVLFETQFDLIVVGYTIVLIVFVGGGLGFVGWVKQRLGSPLVNVACSLTSLTMITVLTKENAVQTGVFSNHKIVQNLKMLLLALVITSSVNLLLWPISARREVRSSMIKATDALGDLLTTITHSFLSGDENDLKSIEFQATIKQYKQVFVTMKKNLREAKAEHYIFGREKEYAQEARIVKSLNRLSQSIGGLRSAAMTQFSLLREAPNFMSTPSSSWRPDLNELGAETLIRTKPDRFAVLAAIDEDPNESSDIERNWSREDLDQSIGTLPDSMPTIRSPSEIFSRFIVQLGPSMKSLAYTLSQMLNELPFDDGPDFKIAINDNFRASLSDAISLYTEHRRDALDHLYKSKDIAKERTESIEADFEEVAASCGYFSFSLLDFAQEMQTYLEILEDLKLDAENPKRKSWDWLKVWRRWIPANWQRERERSDDEDALLAQETPNSSGKLHSKDAFVLPKGRRSSNVANEDFTIHEATAGILRPIVKFLQRDDIRFAAKVGIGAALWALLAFIPQTRPTYMQYRGEWGLLSFMLVCSMTVGASNTTGMARFIGTLIGATLACGVWVICEGNPWALGFCCWTVSLYCFYLIVAAGRAPFGRFTLLTFNLSALYAYSLSIKEGEDDDDEGGINPIITEIAFHRLIAVLGGVIWGLIITRMIWPISARQKFKDGLSALWLRMGVIWGRDPLSVVLDDNKSNAYINIKEELALQKFVMRLDALRNSATSEYELTGPFPSPIFARIMDSTNKMLDAFHSLQVIIHKDLKANAAETAILKYTAKERKELSDRISHLFQVLASSLKLEFKVSSRGVGVTNARDRLLARVWRYRKLQDRNVSSMSTSTTAGSSFDTSATASETNSTKSGKSRSEDVKDARGKGREVEDDDDAPLIATKDEDFELLYAYALVTGQLAEEIERVEREITALFGVLEEEMMELY